MSADRNHPIDRRNLFDGMPMLEIVRIRFFDGLPTMKCSVLRRVYCVFRVERGNGGRVFLVECLVILHTQHTNLLRYFWIDPVFLLGEGRQSKADCQPYQGNC